MARAMWKVLAVQLAASVALTGAGHAAPDPQQTRLALVIGNGAYTGLPAVPSCVASAHVVTAALQRAGYKVTEQVNESNGRMGAALNDFSDALAAAPDGAAILYACGYAVGFDGRVFLLPVSARLERKTDVLTQGVVGRLLLATVVRSKAKANLVLLDTVAAPGGDAVPMAGLGDGMAMDGSGFVAVTSTSAPPEGASTMANALAAAFAQPSVEVKATVQALQNAFTNPKSVGLVSHEPFQPAYLVGAPEAVQAPTAPDGVVASAPAAPAVLSPVERRRVQVSLQRLGYLFTKVNGIIGADTIAAIRRYQVESGMPPTGQLTPEQLGRLLEDGR